MRRLKERHGNCFEKASRWSYAILNLLSTLEKCQHLQKDAMDRALECKELKGQLKESNDRLSEKLHEKNSEVETLKFQLSGVEGESTSLSVKTREMESGNLELLNSITEVNKEIDKLQDRLEKVSNHSGTEICQDALLNLL